MKPTSSVPMKSILKKSMPILLTALFVSVWMPGSISESRVTPWTCEMNAYFNGDRSQQIERYPILSGRGLLSCQNVSGFNFNVPLQTSLKVHRTLDDSDTSSLRVVMYSKPFIISRDLSEVYDRYSHQGNEIRMLATRKVDILMTGQKRGLALPLQISVPEESLGNWQVDSLELDFDESAPQILY